MGGERFVTGRLSEVNKITNGDLKKVRYYDTFYQGFI